MVFQDGGLFNRSIADNIRVGRPDASDAEIERALRQHGLPGEADVWAAVLRHARTSAVQRDGIERGDIR